MLDHHLKPLLKVFLHSDSAPFHQVLNPFNFSLQFFQFSVLTLVLLLVLVDATLKLVFFISTDKLTVVVDHAAKSILLPDLLDLIR